MEKTTKSWKDINLTKFIQLNLTNELEDEIDRVFQRIGIIYDLSQDEVANISIADYQSMKIEMEFMDSQPSQTDFKETVEYQGVKYHFNKNLNTLCLGEFVDLESYSKDTINNLPSIMGILYRPEGITSYNTDTANQSSIVFEEHMDVETALAGLLFFYLFANDYLMSDIPNSSMLTRQIQGMEILKTEMLKAMDEKHLLN